MIISADELLKIQNDHYDLIEQEINRRLVDAARKGEQFLKTNIGVNSMHAPKLKQELKAVGYDITVFDTYIIIHW